MSLLDEVKQRLDIVQVISRYVDLDTSSRIPKALCPFHAERTPSFVVYPESGSWHCFGACATGGDAVSFIMKKEGVPFTEALHRLADDLGIPWRDSPAGPKRSISDLYEANEAAARYFKTKLKSHEGEAARKYLEGRGISIEAADRRGIGLAPAGLETLAGHLKARGVDARAAVAAGLVTKLQDGTWRDMFRGRLTIEIRDAQGRLCGFGARSLDGSEPKYLNTAKSETFDKGRLLYALNWAAEKIRASGEAVVVEGYMDAITAHEHGAGNVVACMGTAVTGDQLNLLTAHVRSEGRPGKIVLCLDTDAAGQDATLKELLEIGTRYSAGWRREGAGRRIHEPPLLAVAVPEGGKDPDEIIRSDPAAWRQAIVRAVPFAKFMIEAYAARVDVASSEGKAQLFETLRPMILSIWNSYEQDRYWTLLSRKMGVPEERVRAMLTRPASGATQMASSFRRRAGASETQEERLSFSQVAAALESSGQDAIEEHLLALLLRHDGLRDYALAVPEEHFLDSANREIFIAWRSSPELQTPETSPGGPLRGKIERLKARPLPPADHLQRVDAVNQCVRRLRERYLRLLKALEEKAFSDLESKLTQEQREELRQRTLEPNSRLRQVFTGPGRAGPASR